MTRFLKIEKDVTFEFIYIVFIFTLQILYCCEVLTAIVQNYHIYVIKLQKFKLEILFISHSLTSWSILQHPMSVVNFIYYNQCLHYLLFTIYSYLNCWYLIFITFRYIFASSILLLKSCQWKET